MSKQLEIMTPESLAGCTRLGVAAMDTGQAGLLAGVLSALADPTRLRLMSLIAAADEACVCDLTAPFTVSQPTISHHLRVLREAGLVESTRRGTWIYYRARRDTLQTLGRLFSGILAPR